MVMIVGYNGWDCCEVCPHSMTGVCYREAESLNRQQLEYQAFSSQLSSACIMAFPSSGTFRVLTRSDFHSSSTARNQTTKTHQRNQGSYSERSRSEASRCKDTELPRASFTHGVCLRSKSAQIRCYSPLWLS